MPSSYALTLRDVINGAFYLIGEYQGSGKDGKSFTWLEARGLLQDMLLETVRHTGVLRDQRVIFCEADEQVYDLPSDCIRILRVGIHTLTGEVVLPSSISERDYQQMARSSQGYPTVFYRDHSLAPNQIGFIPYPNQDGSSFVRGSDYGLLRRVVDEDGNALPMSSTAGGLRTIRGVPLRLTGSGNIIRDLVSLYGNIQVTYVRAPEKWEEPDGYPDADIPEYIHKDLKYGLAVKLGTRSRKKIHRMKAERFAAKWLSAMMRMQRHSETLGPLEEAKPI
jgi:hypothetical protein